MNIEFTPEQIERMTKLWGNNHYVWLDRLLVAASVVYEVPIAGEIVGRPKFHWLVWVNRDNPADAHMEKRNNKWKDKKAEWRIESMHYHQEDAEIGLNEYLASLE